MITSFRSIIVAASLAVMISNSPAQQSQQWYSRTTSMPKGKQMYGSAVLGNFIYLIGGNDNTGYTKEVIMAPVKDDGQLGAWQVTTPLPVGRSYISNSTMALNDIVYVVCGWDGNASKATKTIMWSRPKADGSLEPWRESMPYPGALGTNCSVAVATPGYIHSIGGQSDNDAILSEVWSARVGTDGSITGWEASPALPTPLWFHCGGVVAGRVWVWGGLTRIKSDSVQGIVYTAPILSSGKLGTWQTATGASLPQPFYSASCTVTGNYLLSFCGRYKGNVETNDVWFATASPQGLSKWERLPTDLPSRLYLGLGTDYRRGFVYIPGGRKSYKDKGSLDNNVYFFQLSGSRGSQATPAAGGIADTAEVAATIDMGGGDRLSYTEVAAAGGAHAGFMGYEQGRLAAQAQRKPMVLYFFNDRARRCAEQKEILKSFDAQAFAGKVVFTEADTIKFPQVAQQYGVFRIPHWVMFDAAGNQMFNQSGILQAAQLQDYAGRLAK